MKFVFINNFVSLQILSLIHIFEEAEEKTKSGIILSSAAQEKPQFARVVAVGPGGVVAVSYTHLDVYKRQGVYANLNWFNNYLDYDKLKKKYSSWLAQYNSVNELNCDIWQNSSTGRAVSYTHLVF